MSSTEIAWYILEMVRPAQDKVIVLIIMLMVLNIDIFIRTISIYRICGTIVFLDLTIDDTCRGHFATTIDALLYMTAADVHVSVLSHAASKDHRSEYITYIIIVTGTTWIRHAFFRHLHRNHSLGSIVVTSIACTIDISTDNGSTTIILVNGHITIGISICRLGTANRYVSIVTYGT